MTAAELDTPILAGVFAVLPSRVVARRKSAADGTIVHVKGNTIVSSEASADLAWVAYVEAVADEIKEEGRDD